MNDDVKENCDLPPVGEVLKATMMISDRDSRPKSAIKEIELYLAVKVQLKETKTKLTDTEKTLSDALKREKVGAEPAMKQKTDLEKKLNDIENKLRGSREMHRNWHMRRADWNVR